MKAIPKQTKVPATSLAFLPLALATYLVGCSNSDDGSLPIPVPDTFDAYFVAGEVCMPSEIATGTTGKGTAPGYPIRFDICRHRCITLDRTTAYVRRSWQCAAGQCSMMMLAGAVAHRVEAETGCDGRELVDPPPSDCTPETFIFDEIDPPYSDGDDEYLTGNMRVTVPFMDLEQAEEVSRRMADGESPQLVVGEVVGEPSPDRIWSVNFDPDHAVVTDGEGLSGSDCHAIATP